MLRRLWGVVAVVALTVAACSGDGEMAGPTTTTDPSTESTVATETTEESSPEVSTTMTATSVVVETTVAPIPTEPAMPDLGLELVVLDQPDPEPRPLLSWQAVTGATTYTVLVRDPDGSPWWAWTGETTEVILGGVAEAVGGPQSLPGTTWVVFAYDADRNLVAVSPEASFG